jgi:hypothetical protein
VKYQQSLPVRQIAPYLTSLGGDLVSAHVRHAPGERSIHVPPGNCRVDCQTHSLTWNERKLPHNLRGHHQVTSSRDHSINICAGYLSHVKSPPGAVADPTRMVLCPCATLRWLTVWRPKSRCSASPDGVSLLPETRRRLADTYVQRLDEAELARVPDCQHSMAEYSMSTAMAKLAPKLATHGDIGWSTLVPPAGFEPALPPPETGTP